MQESSAIYALLTRESFPQAVCSPTTLFLADPSVQNPSFVAKTMAQTKDIVPDSPCCEAITSKESYHDLVSKLPRRQGWAQPLVLYKGYWLRDFVAKNIMRLEGSFKPRSDDIILATNPKCGNTWLKALAYAVTTRSQYADLDRHPLLSQHPQEVVPFIEIPRVDGDLTHIETLPSPRLLATHIPPSLWPASMRDGGSRVVYICREPKDTFVSRWHFENNIFGGEGGNNISMKAAFDMFCDGFSVYGPFWDHCLEYWRASVARPDRVLFLRYEEMMADPVRHVTRLAAFLGVPFTGEEEEREVPESVVRLCSFETLSGLETNQTGELMRQGNVVLKKSVFFRKGKVGDWVNHMSVEMGRKLDDVLEEKLKGSGLVL